MRRTLQLRPLLTTALVVTALYIVSASPVASIDYSESCFDDPLFRWEGNVFLNCLQLTSDDKDIRCDWTQDGIAVRESCPVSCGVCTGPCFNDPTYRRNGKANKNCGVFLKKDKYREQRCNKNENGLKVSDYCPASCGTCTACDDDPTFRWKGDETLTCEVFTETDKEKRCLKKQDGVKVRDYCRASCGICVSETLAPTPSPTLSNDRFVDISAKLAKYATEELAHVYVQKPWSHYQAPTIFDINGDGFPDMLSHHHVGDYEGEMGVFLDMALSSQSSEEEVTYTAGKADVVYKGRILDESTLDIPDGAKIKYDIEPKCLETNNLGNNSIVDEYNCVDYPDFHGTATLDFDRDGNIDMFVSLGGAGGDGTGIGVESMLFWGEDADTSSGDLKLSGGRGALIDAGLRSGKDQRSYGVYLADFNNDGYLDFFPMNKYNKILNDPDDAAPGLIYMNRGPQEPRSFDAHPEVSMFASAALLTDFDQDGFANEFLILERSCTENEPNCVDQPRAFVYKWDAENDAFTDIWTSEKFSKDTNLVSAASGDFNGDGLTDIVILTERRSKGAFYFWYSNGDQEYLGSSALISQIPSDCIPRHSMRVADFDLNGMLDLFVLCKDGEHMIFEQAQSGGTWSAWDAEILGPLGDPEQNKASTQAYVDRCFGDNLDQCESSEEELATIKGKININKAVSQGVTVFDHNNDGFLDLFLANKSGINTLFENKGVPGNQFISFKLKGTTNNIDGIGAILMLTWNNGEGTEEKIQLWEHNAQSFESDSFGSRDSRIVFGLGQTGMPLSLEVRWPSGQVSTLAEEMLRDAPITMNYNEILTITEPESGSRMLRKAQ